jgi:hypothetical protein
MYDALALGMSNFRGLGLAILKGRIAHGAYAFGLNLAAAANQPGVANNSVGAQMSGDGEVVNGANNSAHFSS